MVEGKEEAEDDEDEDDDEEEGLIEVDALPTAHTSPRPAHSSPLKSMTSSLLVKSMAVLPAPELTLDPMPLRDANIVRSRGRSEAR